MNGIEGEDDHENKDDAAAGCYPHGAIRHSRGPAQNRVGRICFAPN
jgi:hypothetical protein